MGERNPGTTKATEDSEEENQEKEKRTKMHTQDGRTRRGVERTSIMDELERIKKLAGLYDNPHATQDSMGENISQVATAKAEYQRKHDIRPGTQEWFKLWFAQPRLTGENPMPKK
jgi:predicted aminopeptidase